MSNPVFPVFPVFPLLPPRMVDNENSLLDLTDLVIIRQRS